MKSKAKEKAIEYLKSTKTDDLLGDYEYEDIKRAVRIAIKEAKKEVFDDLDICWVEHKGCGDPTECCYIGRQVLPLSLYYGVLKKHLGK